MFTTQMSSRKEVSITRISFLFLVLLALGLGAFYRFPGLDRRPMHTDEAILGMKLADYAQSGHFHYDPNDYHGPALHQVSLIWAKVAGWGDPTSWTEHDLRVVAVICGMLLLTVTLLFADVLGRLATAMAMLMCAVSPMMAFYSRYFIMEMQLTLLVALTLACFWRYSQNGGRLWLIAGGCCLGFQHATKETFILNIAAALAGWLIARALIGDFQAAKSSGLRLSSSSNNSRPTKVWLWVLIPAIFISIASYSGGFHDWKAVQDSLMSYANYFQRSDGSGHEKPWHYYLSLIFWRKDTLVWSEAMIGGLGLVGMLYAFVGDFKSKAHQAFLVFLSIYTLALFFGYSILSYKTPWCILSAQYSLTLLAGSGAGWIWTWLGGSVTRLIYKLALGLGIWHLCYLTSITTGSNAALPYEADSRNPYVYSHTSPNLLRLLEEVKKIRAERAPESPDIQVINQDSGWPLPWYWRAEKNVGYQTTIPEKLTASVIIVDSEQLPAVRSLLEGRDYRERGPFGLRPGVLVSILVEKVYAPESKTVAPVHPDKPSPSLGVPEGTISTSPTLMPMIHAPVLPNMGAAIPRKP
jgi:uncharacterized protein (TIGR03663 family)